MANPPEREVVDLIERLLMGVTLFVVFLVLVDSRLRHDRLGTPERSEAPEVVVMAPPPSDTRLATELPRILTVSTPPHALERCIDGVQLRPLENGWEQIGTCL